MRIVTWVSTDAPSSATWSARFLMKGGFLPVVFLGATEASVREKAQTFWDSETAKRAKAPMETRLGQLQAVPDADSVDDLL